MFRSKAKQRRIFTHRRRPRRFSWLGAIASVGLFLLTLELLTRIFVDLSGDRSKYARAELKSDLINAYNLDFVSSSELERSPDRDSLQATSNISVGYSLVGDRQTELWQINQEGFRDREAVPRQKPPGEIRVFLLGNSTAFGYGSPNNSSTISAQLESRLQQRLQQQQASPQQYQPATLPQDEQERQKYLAKPPRMKPGNYRVINAAVPGYASGNELAQLALQVLKYQPDLIVVLNGYQDLLLPSDRSATTAPLKQVNREDKLKSLGAYLDRALEPIQNNSYLAQITAKRWVKPQGEKALADFLLDESTGNLVRHLPQDQAELQARVDRYLEHQKQMLSLSAAARVPLLVAIQPEITGRNPSQLTATEGKIATELGRTYIKQVRESYPVLIGAAKQLARSYPNNIKVLDLYKLTDKYPSPSFVDAIHLNEAANQKVAEQLYYGISSLSKMQLKPQLAPQATSAYVPRR
ncbi:MAG: SGNH/GDSL hydrolase family protein [Cyanobacteria bacterium J06623_7]